MLTNPFESDLTCLRRMCSFLVAQFRADIGLCGEGLEDIWFHPPVFSIWASADVLDALTDAVKLIKESSADDLDLAPKVEGLDSAFRNTLTELIKDLERDRTARCNHARDQLGAGPINNIPRVLDGVLLDLHRGLPFPRSITAGDTKRGGYPYWSDFQLFSSGAVYRYLRKQFAKGYPPDAAVLHEWVNRSLPCYLWTADWNCLRAGTLGQDLPEAADEHALIKTLGDGFNCYATPLRPFLHYGTFPPLSGRVGQSLADMFLGEQFAGCMVAAGPNRVGWTITPPKLLSGAADLLASAVALEVLAPALVDQLLAQSSKAEPMSA